MKLTKEQIVALVEKYNSMAAEYNRAREGFDRIIQSMVLAGIPPQLVAVQEPGLLATQYDLMGLASSLQLLQVQLSQYLKLKNPDGSERTVDLDGDGFTVQTMMKMTSFPIINLGQKKPDAQA